jgi:hypothetical protein
MSEPEDQQQSDEGIQALRETLRAIREQAQERTWMIKEHGHRFGPPGQELTTDGGWDIVAPKVHPVWADELRRETALLRKMGEPIIRGLPWNYDQPWERDARAWPRATSGEEPQLSPQEHNRRLGLSLEERTQEHEARWAAIEARLAALGQGWERPNTDRQVESREQGLER